jgi:hypothetical protein
MPSQEFHELKEIVDRIEGKVDVMTESLKRCQARCHIDNPPRGWNRFFRFLTSTASLVV